MGLAGMGWYGMGWTIPTHMNRPGLLPGARAQAGALAGRLARVGPAYRAAAKQRAWEKSEVERREVATRKWYQWRI